MFLGDIAVILQAIRIPNLSHILHIRNYASLLSAW